MRIFVVGGTLILGIMLALSVLIIQSHRPQTLEPIIGFLHVECTQYKVCQPEPHIYYVDLEGSNLFATTPNSFFEYAVEWNPHDARFVFSADFGDQKGFRHLYLADFRGDHIRQLTRDACHQDYPQWSPDGQWIAYVQSCGSNQMLMKVQADGRRHTTLAYDYEFVGAPIWSSDGQFLIVPVKIGLATIKLFRFDAFRPSAQRLFPENDMNESRSVFSPDGQWLLVQRWRDFDQWIFKVHITNHESVMISEPSSYALAPQWSPDGKWIYYIDRDRNNALVRVDADGNNMRILTQDAWEPRVDPSGQYILFLRQLSQLAMMRVDDSTPQQIPTPTGNVYEARWVNLPSFTFDPLLPLVGAGVMFVFALLISTWRFSF
ncbi:MAG: hypothetical protein CUN55_02090 [Phototrophicales bacterium]|nr:MAG: hypothetical protein CUN55_02090 [Phototrophicales bacterium]